MFCTIGGFVVREYHFWWWRSGWISHPDVRSPSKGPLINRYGAGSVPLKSVALRVDGHGRGDTAVLGAVVLGTLIVGAAVTVALTDRVLRLTRAKADTERHNVALAAQIEVLAPVLDDSPIGFVVFDADLRYTYVNRAIAELHRRSVREYHGRTLLEMFPDTGLDHVPASLREVLETGVAQVDLDQPTRVGDEIKHLVVNRYPVRGADGAPIGVAVTYLDITDRSRLAELEAEAGALRARAELVFKHEEAQRIAALGTWELDLETGVRSWSKNLHEILGVSDESFAVMEVGEYVHPNDRATILAMFGRLRVLGEPYRVSVRLTHADGHVIHAVCTGQVVRDASGNATRLWGTVQDVTEQFAMEAARRDAVRKAEAVTARLETEHHMFRMVQRALLPESVPQLPGVEVAVAYQPIENVAEVGGDWYDAFVLPDGRLGIAVGDVAGHDLRAATAMGQVRNALRAYAMEDPRPGRVLRRVNSLLMALPDTDLVTAVFGVYDPATHCLTFSRAGHPLPLVRIAGRTTVMEEPRGIVLGAMVVPQLYAERTVALMPGDAMVLYTDGLVERRGTDTMTATARMCELLNATPVDAPASEIIDVVTDHMIDRTRLEDDVCVLVLRRPFSFDPGSLRPVGAPVSAAAESS
jgi:PAS domain S-box-containing protein